MPDDHVHVLGFAGSLRTESFNRMLLGAAERLAPPTMTVETFDLLPVPLFNADVEEQGDPEPVRELKERIGEADALLIVTPEYQHGVPGVLKNALDWASRPPGQSPMQRKPVAIMGASPGMTATARAQTQLRQTLTYNDMRAVQQPEVLIGRAADKFDGHGQLNDQMGQKLVGELLTNLYELASAA